MKKRIILISCVSKKASHRTKVRNLYTSTLFKLNLKYAEQLEPDAIYVISAKHGVLPLDVEIEPYETTLNNMPVHEIKEWAVHVVMQLKKISDLDQTKYIFLAGDKYRKFLLPHLKSYEIPLKGLRIGEQLQKLKELTL